MEDWTSLFGNHGVPTPEPRKPQQLKVLVTGPFSAGKTTFIRTISEIETVATERNVSGAARSVKPNTTVALDFGRITFGTDLALYVFGTPGQRRFEVMWEILSEGMLGFVVLVRAADADSLEEASHILRTFQQYSDVPYVVGVTHLDRAPVPSEMVIAEVRAAMDLGEAVVVQACDPRDKVAVRDLLMRILLEVLQRLRPPRTAPG